VLNLFSFSVLSADFNPFVTKLLELEHKLRDSNLTIKEAEKITDEMYHSYIQHIEHLLLNKNNTTKLRDSFNKKIFMIKKIIKHAPKNKDKYAIAKDEILIKSNQVLFLHHEMLNNIITALEYDLENFEQVMGDEILKNKIKVDKILNETDYSWIFTDQNASTSFQEAKKNIYDFYFIVTINTDSYSYLAHFIERVYRLNKYKKYHMLPLALYLDYTPIGKKINPVLERYNLSIVKLLLMFIFSILLYLIRTRLYKIAEYLFSKSKALKAYNELIVVELQSPINYILMAITLNLITNIYYDFSNPKLATMSFNIIYTILLAYIVHVTVHAIANIYIEEIEKKNRKIKKEMINIAIKIWNFVIINLALLLVLHFSGINLIAILSGLGIGGLAIAIAAKESLSDFLGTISILMSDIYSQGDRIEAGNIHGTVVEIGLRFTTIRTFDNSLSFIPNGKIINQDVKNWHKRVLGRLIKLTIGIKYSSDPKDIQIVIDEITHMLQDHPEIITEETMYDNIVKKTTKFVSQEDSLGIKRNLFVALENFSDSSIDIMVYCFTKNIDWGTWLKTREEIMYNIMQIMDKNGLEFAFPSISLYPEEERSSIK